MEGAVHITGDMFDPKPVAQQSVAYRKHNQKQRRCPDCGKLITIVPCVRCKIKGAQ